MVVVNMMLTTLETKSAARLLEDLLALFTQWGAPLDSHDDIKFQRKVKRRNPHVPFPRPSGRRAVPILFGKEFRFVASEFIEKFRQRYVDTAPGLYIDRVVKDVFPVYSHGDADVKGFIMAGVSDLAGARLYPIVVPADVIDFSVSLLGSKADRVRFLCELACVYRDAVRFGGQSVRVERGLVGSLRNIVGLLRVVFGEYCDDESADAGGGSDDAGND